MASVPSSLNSVSIQFKDGVINDIDQKLVDALKQIIKPGAIPYQYFVSSIVVSSLHDSHKNVPNSRHNQKKAIDISKINGKSISNYNSDPEIKSLVQRIQTEFENISGRRENFGPFKKLKLGAPYSVSRHHDHIHLSVN